MPLGRARLESGCLLVPAHGPQTGTALEGMLWVVSNPAKFGYRVGVAD